ncbi:MAG: hypothetical protein RIR51_1602 [Bacteroidota bacterium]|jgi:polyisoprenoid-binding protein YceI
MKKVLLISAIVLGTIATSFAQNKTLKISNSASSIQWYAEKVTGKHNGTVDLKSGEVSISGNKLVGGSFTVELSSLKDVDIEDAGYRGKLEGHLKSADFFDAEKFPTATFKIKSVNGNTISGDMTIKGKTNPVSFPATVSITNGKLVASAEITIDRTKYGLIYNSKSFFASIGDKAIYDDFKLVVKLVSE